MTIILGERHSDRYRYRPAQVVELVDALDSKSSTERCVGSIPTLGTILMLTVVNLVAILAA